MENLKKVAFYTLGCKLNFSETSSIGRQFENYGFSKVDFTSSADVYVINTCSVTDHADRKCKKVVNQALKHNPNAFIAIVGCYAQLKPQEIAQIPGVDAVFGASEKFELPKYIGEGLKLKETQIHIKPINEVDTFVPAYSFGDRTRTFLKVQDGCNYSCTFCTIPLARGHSRSTTIESVIEKAKEAASQGVKEIVLTGVNLGDFGLGTDLNSKNRPFGNFYELIQELDSEIDIDRFRISSIEPNLLTDDIITWVSTSKKFVPHFHIPLQSGNDRILKAMRRRYLRNLYVDKVTKIKNVMPDCCIGVDVIVGFPGETDEEFLDTYNFINELQISYLHVFTYSERENTEAALIKEVIPNRIRSQRNEILTKLSETKKKAFYESQIGKVLPVLFEHEKHNAYMYGFTSNYVKVKAIYDPLFTNEIKMVKLLEIDIDGYVLVEDADVEVLQHI